MQPPISILLYEDNKNVREFITDYLDASDQMYIREAFAHADEAVAQVTQLQPDVILMDIEMPGTNGIEALKAIKQAHPQAKVLMQTVFNNAEHLLTALCWGASGYILKSDLATQLKQAIQIVHSGGGFLSPSTMPIAIQLFTNKSQ
ncbi:MAG: response regulator transcription factor [Saprospiraceae bacterium]